MDTPKRLPYDLGLIAEAFDLAVSTDCPTLQHWLDAHFTLSEFELANLNYLYEQVRVDGKYWNEEELKIRFIGGLFSIAQIDVQDKIKVFYERPLSATVNDYYLTVVADCLVATPLKFNTPKKPYFFYRNTRRAGAKRKTDTSDRPRPRC